jgi:L-malate glycosyltransferase
MKSRALMIIHNFRPGQVGGAELQAERLAARLAGLGHSMQVLTRLTIADAPLEEMQNEVRIHRLPYPLPYWINRDNALTFRFLFRNRRSFDVLHAHQAFGHAVVAAVFARSFNKKCVVKIACAGQYGDLSVISEFGGFDRALRILHQADAMVALSNEVKQELLDYGFRPDRIFRIPNGVDTAHFRRTQPLPDRKRTRFIQICRRHPQKGVDSTLQAALHLKERGFGERFEINLYGADYAEFDYRSMAQELGVADVVAFYPFVQDIISVYHSAHCLLLPSRAEGLSNSLLEAMAMELPAIATPVSGTLEVVDDGVNGMLIPPDAPDRLAAAMSSIISDPELSGRLGSNARTKVEDCYSLEKVAAQYAQLYEQLQHSSH